MPGKVPMTMVDYYNLHNKQLSPQQFYRTGLGLMGGPRGTYGSYAMGPVTNRAQMKRNRERQSGE